MSTYRWIWLGLSFLLTTICGGWDLAAQAPDNERLKAMEAELTTLFQRGELETIAQRLEQWTTEKADQRLLVAARRQLAIIYLQKQENEAAVPHIDAILKLGLERYQAEQDAASLATAVNVTDPLYRAAGQAVRADKSIEAVLAKLDYAAGELVTPEVSFGRSLVIRLRAAQRRSQGNAAEGLQLLEADLGLLLGLYQQDSSSAVRAEQCVAAMLSLMVAQDPEMQPKTFDRMQEFVVADMQQGPSVQVLNAYLAAAGRYATSRITTDLVEANRVVSAMVSVLEGLPSDAPELADSMTQGNQAIEQLRGSIAIATRLKAMLGQPAPPMTPQHWVNGGPLNAANLKGKVIVLDFWAAWNEPSLVAMNGLKQVAADYEGKPVQVIGVTQAYGLSWDEESQRARRVQEPVSIEAELEVLGKLFESLELGYPTMVISSESSMPTDYAVTSIPHTVVIDRSGRMVSILIGSNPNNLIQLRQAIDKALLP